MAKPAETLVQVTELGNGKFLLIAVLSEAQVKATYEVFEPYSRSWRGRFQSLARGMAGACAKWAGKAS
jgi:hypothetical protein